MSTKPSDWVLGMSRLTLNVVGIDYADAVKDLGRIVDSGLSWQAKVIRVAKHANNLRLDVRLLLVKSLVL